MNESEKQRLLDIITGLMVSDHLGDVHDEINGLCDLAGIPRPKGNYLEGWTKQDWANVRRDDEDDE